MKRLLLVLLSAVVLTAADVREEILVVVNSHILTRKGFQQAYERETGALYRKHSGKELDAKLLEARTTTLQGLIDSFVVEDKAAELGLQIADDQIHAYLDELKKQNKFSSDADLERAIRTELGVGLPEYIQQLKTQELKRMVLGREVFSKMAVEEQELRAYYEEHKNEYRRASRIHIRELVIPKGATPEEQAQAKEKLATVQDALKAGQTFEDLAKLHSASPSKTVGGDLGWMNKGLLRAAVEQAALALKPNEVSTPIETDKDIILVQLIASEDDAPKPFSEVKDEIMVKIQDPKAESAVETYLNGLRLRANIRFLVPREKIIKG